MCAEFIDNIFYNKYCRYIDAREFNGKVSNYKGKFSLFHVNIRSLSANFDTLVDFLSTLKIKFSLICLTETKLEDYSDKLFQISGYSHYSIYRNSHGGGIRLYYLKSISISIALEYSGVFDMCEVLSAKVFLDDGDTLSICCIYRPPSNSKTKFAEFIKDYIKSGFLSSRNSVIVGDLNMDLRSGLRSNIEFYNYLISESFRILITVPTFINKNVPLTILDQICIKSSLFADSFVF